MEEPLKRNRERPRWRMRRSGSQGVKILENLTRLGAFTGGDVPALLEDVKDSGGASVPEAESPLKKRSARLFFLAHHFEAFLDQFFVLVAHLILFGRSSLGEALV